MVEYLLKEKKEDMDVMERHNRQYVSFEWLTKFKLKPNSDESTIKASVRHTSGMFLVQFFGQKTSCVPLLYQEYIVAYERDPGKKIWNIAWGLCGLVHLYC